MVEKRPKTKHNTLLRLRNEIADALDRIQWEDGIAKSAVIAEAVESWLRKRQKAIFTNKRPAFLSDERTRGNVRPESTLVDRIRKRIGPTP